METQKLNCNLVSVVSMFTKRSYEFAQKYQCTPNNMMTDFNELIKSKVSVYKL